MMTTTVAAAAATDNNSVTPLPLRHYKYRALLPSVCIYIIVFFFRSQRDPSGPGATRDDLAVVCVPPLLFFLRIYIYSSSDPVHLLSLSWAHAFHYSIGL